MEKPPEFLGPYKLGEMLGRGGMGSVFSGVDNKSGNRVAVKLIAAHVSDDMRFRRRFGAEIETLKRLRHKNIVQLIGYGEEQGRLFYSMELVEGESLQARIRRDKRLNWMTAIDIAIQVCAALKHAHDIGAIHRDLKPANLILTDNDRVKLVDFGIVRIFGSSEQTMVGSVLGTADYMAPEQASNEGITQRTDLYALGSVMYAMLTGRPPFKGKSITAVIESLKREKPIPLDVINPEVPEALVEIVHELLEKSPDDRPPTALAVMNRLKSMRAGLQRGLTVDRQEGKTQVKRGTGTNLTGVQSDFHPTPSNPSANTVHQPGMSPTDATLAVPSEGITQQRVDQDDAVVDTAGDRVSKTHFQTVEIDSRPSRGTILGTEKTHTESGVGRAVSIGLMIAALSIGGLLVAYAIRGPSSDDSYVKIITIRDATDLSDASTEINRFLTLFPDDYRYPDVQGMRDSLDLARFIRDIRRRLKFARTPLEQYEQKLLEAMDLRETDSALAQEKLNQWLAVFVDSTIHADDDLRRMAELVQFEIENLERKVPVKKEDARIAELLSRIKKGEQLPKDERQDLLENLVELYVDEKWATPVVQAAKNQLAELDSPQ